MIVQIKVTGAVCDRCGRIHTPVEVLLERAGQYDCTA
jgi:uncharacterized OB-fold protein